MFCSRGGAFLLSIGYHLQSANLDAVGADMLQNIASTVGLYLGAQPA